MHCTKASKWESSLAPGGLYHVRGFDTAGDLYAADVWEAEEQMNAFVSTRLVHGFQKRGIPIPDVSVFPAHDVNVYPDASRFALE